MKMWGRVPWSTGCLTCRKRKIKCDEAKPECARCRKIKKQCPGYRSTEQMVFHSMTASVAAKAVTPSTIALPPPPTLYIRPSTDWEQYAIGRFFAHFVEVPSKYSPGYLEFLPEMIDRSTGSSQDALLAASLASLANVAGMCQLQLKSKIHYSLALKALRAALDDISTATSDDTLLSMILLQTYECIAGIQKLENSAHDTAIAELLRLREIHQPGSKMSKRLSFSVRVRRELQGVEECTNEEAVADNPPQSPESSLLHMLRRVYRCCSILRSTVSQVRGQNDLAGTIFQDALQNALDIYSDVLVWPHLAPPNWVYLLKPAPEEILFNGISQVFHFGSVQHAAIWTMYFCSRIHLCRTLLQVSQVLHERLHVKLSDIIPSYCEQDVCSTLSQAVDDICSCAPYMLGNVKGQSHAAYSGGESKSLGAFFLLRSLTVVNSIDDLLLRQRRMVLIFLNRVGSQFGIRVAWKVRDEWMVHHRAKAERLQMMS